MHRNFLVILAGIVEGKVNVEGYGISNSKVPQTNVRTGCNVSGNKAFRYSALTFNKAS